MEKNSILRGSTYRYPIFGAVKYVSNIFGSVIMNNPVLCGMFRGTEDTTAQAV